MKKPVVIALVAAAVLAAAWFVFTQLRSGGSAPGAAALDAETTVAAAGAEPIGLWRSATEVLDALPSLAVDNAELKLLTPSALIERLGFDPGTPEGWASVGIDPTGGFTVALDARAFASPTEGLPVFLLRVVDREKFLAAATRILGSPVTVAEPVGPSSVLKVGETRLLLGERRGLTAIGMPLFGDAEASTARGRFDAFLTGQGGTPLAGDPVWRSAFRDAPDALTTWLFTGARAGQAWVKGFGLPAEIDEGVAYYARLFPAFAAWNFYAGEPGGMLLTSPEALRALEQIMRPRKAPPRLTSYMPAGTGLAVRWSTNLGELTSGISALLPPNIPPQVRMGLEMGKALLPMQIGVSYTEIADAISGHFAVAADLGKLQGAHGVDEAARGLVLLMGVQIADRADSLLNKLAQVAKDKLSVETSAVDINGAKGYHVGPPSEGITVVRKDDVLIAGVHEAVDAAVRGTAGLKDPAAACMDDDVALAWWWDARKALALLEASNMPQAKAIVEALRKRLGDASGQAVWARLVGEGMRFGGEGGGRLGGATALMGLFAALAVPAFERYEERARGSDVEAELTRMARGAVAYYHTPKFDQTGAAVSPQFPGGGVTLSAPEEWHTLVCPEGRPSTYTPVPEQFDHPVFKALGFSPTAPARHQFQFVAEGTGTDARFTARAVGDLDCDGVYSTFEKTGRVNADGIVELAPGLFKRDETE